MPDTDPQVVQSSEPSASDAALRRALAALKDLRTRAERAEEAANEPIAIVGMGCRFPAGANSPAGYWDLLHDGRDGVGRIPESRWNHAEYFDPNPDAVGKICTDQGGFIDQAVDGFDAPFFKIAPVEARDMDPQQRLLLEVTWEALEHAGIAPDRLVGSPTGVFVGLSTLDYANLVVREKDPSDVGTYSGTGVAPSVAAGRLSFVLGLRGPNMCIDTACSSSLVALSMATQSLRSGACRMALVGGVNLMLDPQAMVSLTMLHALSPTGRCHTFGAGADGYARGEGAGMVVLKRMSDARADGDRVLAVIRGTAVNHDGRSSGLTVPSGPAQRQVIEHALADARLEPAHVDLVEAHGTGTDLGDPIEVRALDAVYSRGRAAERPLLIGSAKTNVGHLEAAAGIAGVIKTVLALQHEVIPPSLHSEELSPHIDWDAMPVEVNRTLRPWPRGEHVRRAAVSGFGVSGTNAHVILEEAPAEPARRDRAAPPVVLTLAARDDAALAELATGTAETALAGGDLGDLAWTLQRGRARFPRRLAVTATSPSDAAHLLRSWDPTRSDVGISSGTASERPRVAFAFSGQGPQLPGMGCELFETEPVVRGVLEECDAIMRPHLPHSLIDVLHGDADLAALVHQTQYTQPAMFALQCGLAALWRSWGVEPDVVVGHSIGEYAAAVTAGVMDLPTAAEMIAARAALMGALPAGGKMLAVLASGETVAERIAPYGAVAMAAVNGPESVVISGDGDAIDELAVELEAAGVRHRALDVSHVFHSPLMTPMLDDFERRIAGVELRSPSVTFVSTVSGQVEKTAITSPTYWRDQVSSTVRFHDAIDTVLAMGVDQFLEIGPQPTLVGMIGQIRGSAEGLHPSLRLGRGDRSEQAQVLDALGGLWTAGVEPNWQAIDGGRSIIVDAPTYPFQRQPYWIQRSMRTGRVAGGHPLLGTATRVPTLHATIHEADIDVDSPSWIGDHRLGSTVVMPGAAFVEMVLAAADPHDDIESLHIHEALVLAPGETVTVQTIVTRRDDARTVQIATIGAEGSDEVSTIHATATLTTSARDGDTASVDIAAVLGTFPDRVDVDEHDARLDDVGLNHGPSFRDVRDLLRRDGAAIGRIELVDDRDIRRYRLHPALLDACLHVIGAGTTAADGASSDDILVPVEFHGVTLTQPAAASVWCVATLLEPVTPQSRSVCARLDIYDESGASVAHVERIEALRMDRARWERSLPQHNMYRIEWQPQPRESAGDDVRRPWVVVTDDEPRGASLVDALARGGAASVTVVDPSDLTGLDAVLENSAVARSSAPIGVVFLAHQHSDATTDADEVGATLEASLGRALDVTQAAARCSGEVQLWLVTVGAQSTEGERPSVTASTLWGFGRTVANELPQLSTTCIDIDSTEGEDAVVELAAELARPGESQVALRGRRRLVARLVRHDPRASSPLTSPYRLDLSERGSLENISFEPMDRSQPDRGQVEIEVRATGLNFRDVLNVLGMYPGDPGPPGLEVAGVVTAVGDGVEQHRVGDAVVGIAPRAFDSHVITSADVVVAKPDAMAFAEAATLPIAFLTADYGLRRLADLQPGERVLIHAAAGGVGMAAVSIAQRIGAEVFATVGSGEKRRILEALGVRHIYSSRTLEFAEQIKLDTDGRGVDVVLNSLSDEFIDRSFDVLAPRGRFLEIGQRGVWTQERVTATHPDCIYHVYDLNDFLVGDPAGVQQSLTEIVRDVVAGRARALPIRAFPATSVSDAFRFMAQARHIGKVVITHRRSGPVIRSDGGYLVTGGLGGLGLIVAQWLAEQGARHLTLAGRSAPSADAEVVIDRLRHDGVVVDVVSADVSDRAEVDRLVAVATGEGSTLRGVFHAAGVIDDGVVSQQSWSRFEPVLGSKLVAAEHLDAATRDVDLFVLFSSMAALMGSPGQANYAAANAGLDALAMRRLADGRSALSIDWGTWADAGMAARLDDRERQRLIDGGTRPLAPPAALDALGVLLDGEVTGVAVAEIDWARMLRHLDSVPNLLESVVVAEPNRGGEHLQAESQSLPDALNDAEPNQYAALTLDHITQQIARVLGLGPGAVVGEDQDLTELGMDSLMSVELTNRLRSSTGLPLPSDLAFEHPTPRLLATEVLSLLDMDAFTDAPRARTALDPTTQAVVGVSRGVPVAASSAQVRLLFFDQFAPGLAIYNLPVVLRLRGVLDVGALRAAVESLVGRHEALRTNFVTTDEGVMQEIVAAESVVVPFVVREVAGGDLEALLREEVAASFDVPQGVKLRVAVFEVADRECVFALTVHHIAADGWSLTRLVSELGEVYSAIVTGREPVLADLAVQYVDWSVWRRSVEESALHAEGMAYWTDHLGGTLPMLDLPTDRRRPVLQSYRSGTLHLDVDPALMAEVRAAARAAGVTPFVFMLACYTATLARWSGQDDVVVGTASANRSRSEISDVVGLFVNVLAIRTIVDLDRPFGALLDAVRTAARDAFAHEGIPFDRIVEAINPPRHMDRSIIFQTSFIFNNMQMPDLDIAGVEVEMVDVSVGATEYDVACWVTEIGDRCNLRVEYNLDVFEAATIERLVEHWQLLMSSAVKDPDTAVGALTMVSAAERDILVEDWGVGALSVAHDAMRLDQLVAVQAVQRPDAIAVVSGGEEISFGKLLERSRGLARMLQSAGVEPGDRVGVAVDRSVAMVVSLLAVLEAGASYVPLDPSFPSERLAFMVEDAELEVVVVSNGSLDGLIDTAALRVVDVIVDRAEIDEFDSSPLDVDTSGLAGGGVAYVIYTSGSTGRPKGVEIEHASVVNFVRSMIDEPGLGADDVLLAVTTLSFDISVLELFVPLVAGGRVVIAERDDVADGRRLGALITSCRATVMQATPTTWSMLFDAGWQGSENLVVLCGGEAMPVELGRRLVERCGAVWNMFGPTETTIWSTVQRLDLSVLDGVNVPIGRPIANTVIRILDANNGLAPVGVQGELCIGGAGVARGYLNRSTLTAERFVADPYGTDGARLYRTGDLARWLPDGTIEFLGRLDFQVKVRGYRIELGEVESALRGHPGVVDVVVVADGEANAGRLLAYPIFADPDVAPTVAEMRSWMQQHLPDYMVPSRFVAVESFPLTPNRKVDRAALPSPDEAPDVATEYDEPRDDVERVIATIISETLGVDRVGIHDDFFELGGHDLDATRALAAIDAAFGSTIDLRTFLLQPNVAGIGEAIRADEDLRSRVERVAQMRVRISEMSPEEMAEQLAARSTSGEARGS